MARDYRHYGPHRTKEVHTVEERVRYWLRKHRLALRKDRSLYHTANRSGGYQVVDLNGRPIFGEGYVLTLERAERFANELRIIDSVPEDVADQLVKAMFQSEVSRRARQLMMKSLD